RATVIGRGPGDARDQNTAGSYARELAFAIHDARAPRAPADAGGMAVEAGMLQPNLVGHMRRRDPQRTRLQQLEAGFIKRPLDFHRRFQKRFGLAHEAAKCGRLAGAETGRADETLRNCLRHRAGAVRASVLMMLPPAL